MALEGRSRPVKDIGSVHDSLFKKGIWTKSMVQTYIKCPELFRLRYVEGQREAPGYYTVLGKSPHEVLEVLGRQEIDGLGVWTTDQIKAALSERWDVNMDDVDMIPGGDKDNKLPDFLKIIQEWKRRKKSLTKGFGKLEAVEAAYGYDGGIKLGDVPIAGHADAVWENAVGDYKVVKQTSPYRKDKPFNLELVFYHALTGKPEAYLFPMVHDFKRNMNRVFRVGGEIKDWQKQMACDIVGEIDRAVKAGNFPLVHMNPGESFPCRAKWCGFFGKCRYTKGF